MATYELTLARAQEYAKVFDFRTAVVKAARQILALYEIEASGPGDGINKTPRYFTSVDFQIGAANPQRKMPVNFTGSRHYEYCEYTGILSIMNTVPMETEEKSSEQYLTEDHLRELDRLTSLEHAIFMEHVGQFTAELLPMHEVIDMIPIEPDERPIEQREVNAAFRRWRLRIQIRQSAWPVITGT